MRTLRHATITVLLAIVTCAIARANCNITVPVRELCIGSSVTPNHLRDARIMMPGTGEATASIGNDGAITITGVRPGTTTIVVERTTYDENHNPVRCLVIYTVTVIDCDGDDDPGGTGGKGGTGGGRGRDYRPIVPKAIDSFFDITYRVEEAGGPARADAGEKGPAVICCEKIKAWRGTAATGGMIIRGGAGSVPPGSKVTITDSKGNTVTTTANDDGSFTVTEAMLPDSFDHTIGGALTIGAGGQTCTVIIERDRIGGANRSDSPGIG